ncbi:ATP-dependent helicase/nuclease subunit A [Bosea thiooxidans]
MLASYQRQKSLRSLLDYDDLIARTRSLLERVEAAWVLYKLDAGIDHILLDEAQDTGEAQWAILRKLAEEFTGGGDLRAKPRTIFVVGDEKQSIYGFQGAAPAAFGEERRALGRRIAQAELAFEAISLNTSFRSAPDVLQAVDAVSPCRSMRAASSSTARRGRRCTTPSVAARPERSISGHLLPTIPANRRTPGPRRSTRRSGAAARSTSPSASRTPCSAGTATAATTGAIPRRR